MEWQEQWEVVVVGSGAGGLVAAITAAHNGQRVLLVEKTEVFGGSSALSGGGLWIPNNHVSKLAGLEDSEEEALTYMEEVIEDKGPASTRERKVAYIQNGSKMVSFLEDLGMKWVAAPHYPDYYPERPGGKIGRSIEGEVFDLRELGEYEGLLRKGLMEMPFPLYSGRVYSVPRTFTSMKDFTNVSGMLFSGIKYKLQGKHATSIGQGLVSRLLKIALSLGVKIRLNAPLKDLIIENDALIGIEIEQNGAPHFIETKAVILAGGGFDHNEELRRKYHNIGPEWSSASKGNQGDMLLIAQRHGLDTALLDEAWWGPSAINDDGSPSFLVYERSLPHTIIVDQEGKRYFNEAESYVDAGRAMLDKQEETGKAIPSWMIMESRHRNRYLFGSMMPRMVPKKLLKSGWLKRADTIDDLAKICGINVEGLRATIGRFNEFVDNGKDGDYKRGDSAYDNYYGDPAYKNPNLGHINKPPYYAVKVFPGDLGTKGGIVADEHGQALRDGKPIAGLYATGNCSASVMGKVYPGPGSTLGPTTVFGYISANHIKSTIFEHAKQGVI
ncbi:FAD-dependent oxidoreductase [Solibacillus silvestris]|uniref:FAD-dependent oxidoreductase n=1 Tax=Solibacillus silvestris TaxID=76853 RepID=UPI003F81D72D